MSDEVALLVADVYELAGALRRRGESLASAEGLTQARWQVLSAVSEESLTVPQVGRRLGVSRQNVQRVANDLVSLGQAQYLANPDHRSSPLLSLTEAGRSALGRLTSRARKDHRIWAASIPSEEITATRDTIRRMLAELNRHELK
ncbi:MarR family winged helix-turn-helix transcriptional regulator [Streptomyces sp. NPDC020096]